jgi:hypothetical protein
VLALTDAGLASFFLHPVEQLSLRFVASDDAPDLRPLAGSLFVRRPSGMND